MWYGVEEEASVWLGRCLPVCTAVCVSSWTCTCLCVWRSATVSVSSWMDSCPFVWTTLQLSVTPTMHPAIRSSVCPAVCATVHLDVQPSIYLELQLSICPAGCATVHPSMFLAGQSPVCVSGWMWNCLCVQPDRHLSIQLSSHPCIQPYNCPCVQRDEQLTAGGHATVHVSICPCVHLSVPPYPSPLPHLGHWGHRAGVAHPAGHSYTTVCVSLTPGHWWGVPGPILAPDTQMGAWTDRHMDYGGGKGSDPTHGWPQGGRLYVWLDIQLCAHPCTHPCVYPHHLPQGAGVGGQAWS